MEVQVPIKAAYIKKKKTLFRTHNFTGLVQ